MDPAKKGAKGKFFLYNHIFYSLFHWPYLARKHYCERATFIYGGGYFDCSVHMFHDRPADRQAQSGSLNESISFFEPFKYYAELFLRDSAPCVGNAYSCFGRCHLVRNFDIALYGIFQCVRYEVAQNLLDAHRILLYQVGSCRVAFLERYAFRYVGLAFGATFIYQVGEVAPDRGQLYGSGFYLR